MIPVRSLLGLSGIPSHRTSATEWLQRNGGSTTLMKGKGGAVECVNPSDLPEHVRIAHATRQIEAAGLPIGIYDEAAHAAFATMPPTMRAEAERKAEIARFLMTAGQGLTGRQRLAMVRAKFGEEGTSKASLTRIQKWIKGVDPINYAPALLDGYQLHGAPRTDVSEAAFAYFMTTIRDAGPQFPLKQAWRDVRDLAPQMGWRWPSYETIFRRWKELPAAQRLHARLGHRETVKALGMPALRDKTSISPLEWVSLDGRTKDFWVTMPDGKVRRLTFLALVDCASNAVLDWELAESENARSTVRLIKRACLQRGATAAHGTPPGRKGQGRKGGSRMTRFPQTIRQDPSHLADAADDANFLVAYAEDALALMARLIEEGDHDGHHGIPAVLHLAALAFAGWQERYPDALCNIATRLRACPEKGGTE